MSAAMDPGVSDGQVMVTFRLPHEVDADHVCVVGDFNDWSHDAHPMERDGDEFVARIPLVPGRSYRYRYLLDGDRWENDWSADGYQPNEFGGDDSVLDLTGSAVDGLPNTVVSRETQVEELPPAAEPKRTRKKRAAERSA